MQVAYRVKDETCAGTYMMSMVGWFAHGTFVRGVAPAGLLPAVVDAVETESGSSLDQILLAAVLKLVAWHQLQSVQGGYPVTGPSSNQACLQLPELSAGAKP